MWRRILDRVVGVKLIDLVVKNRIELKGLNVQLFL